MICVSVAEPDYEACLKVLEGEQLAELRLDLMNLTSREIQKLFSLPLKLIATCRPGGVSESQRLQILRGAVEAGATYVDIEVEASEDFKDEIIGCCRRQGCEVIVSYHNYRSTPPVPELNRVVETCFKAGADIAKLACRVKSAEECGRLLGLYEEIRPIIAIGMGPVGKITRIAALAMGAPFTYASADKDRQTAEGQIDRTAMRRILSDIEHA